MITRELAKDSSDDVQVHSLHLRQIDSRQLTQLMALENISISTISLRLSGRLLELYFVHMSIVLAFNECSSSRRGYFTCDIVPDIMGPAL